MKVLVTGGSGQLGAALIASAPEVATVWAPSRAELNLADPASVRKAVLSFVPDLVINAGAYTAVDRAEDEPELAYKVNACAPAAFAEAIEQNGSGLLIQVSTDFVFDGAAAKPYHPGDARNPLSVYGKSKADGEDAAGPDAIVLRTSWVHTAGGANFVRTMLRLMRERDTLKVVSDQVGAPSWAPDIARTIWDLASSGQAGVFHHRDAGETSWHGFAQAIGEEAQRLGLIAVSPEIVAVPTTEFPTAAVRPAYSVLDDSATRSLLGYEAAHWRDNLRRMLEEEKALG